MINCHDPAPENITQLNAWGTRRAWFISDSLFLGLQSLLSVLSIPSTHCIGGDVVGGGNGDQVGDGDGDQVGGGDCV